jgi:hypothetical protein
MDVVVCLVLWVTVVLLQMGDEHGLCLEPKFADGTFGDAWGSIGHLCMVGCPVFVCSERDIEPTFFLVLQL